MDHFDVVPDMDDSVFPYLSDSTLLGGRAEKLLAGEQPDDNPPDGVRELGDLLAALRAPASPSELLGEANAVSAFSAAKEEAASKEKALVKEKTLAQEKTAKILRMPSHLGPKVTAATAVALLAFTGVAAAAVTGSLPTPLQSFVHARFGAITAPAATPAAAHPTVHTGTTSNVTSGLPTQARPRTSSGPSASSVGGPQARGASTAGLCHAFSDSAGSWSSRYGQSSAGRSLEAAAAAAGQTVYEFCAPYLSHPKPSTNPTGNHGAAPSGSGGHGHGSQPTHGSSQGQNQGQSQGNEHGQSQGRH